MSLSEGDFLRPLIQWFYNGHLGTDFTDHCREVAVEVG